MTRRVEDNLFPAHRADELMRRAIGLTEDTNPHPNPNPMLGIKQESSRRIPTPICIPSCLLQRVIQVSWI